MPESDVRSTDDAGTQEDAWIFEEILGDDDLPDGPYTHVISEDEHE